MCVSSRLVTPVCFLIFFCVGTLAQEVNGIVFDSDFEGGSLGEVRFDSQQDAWIVTLAHDNGDASLPSSFRRTFFFRCSGVAGREVDIRMEGVYWWFAGNVAVASYDGLNWFRLDPAANSELRVFHQIPQDQDQIYFSYTYPYSVADKDGFLERVASHPYVEVEVIGDAGVVPSVPMEASRIQMITLTNPALEVAGKHGVWVHARIHPGEIPPSFVVEGFVQELLENGTVEAKWLNNHCVFYVVPMPNPTGVYLGNYRTNAYSVNLESVWCSAPQLVVPSPYPEVDALKSTLDHLNGGENPVDIALNLHATMTQVDEGHFHFKHLFPSVSQAFEGIQDNWIESFDQVSPQFNYVSPHTSQLNSCSFVESYLWNHYDESVMALTFETMYMTRDTDDGFLEIEDYRQLGRDMAHAVFRYLNGYSVRLSSQVTGPQNLILFGGKYDSEVTVQTQANPMELELTAHGWQRSELLLNRDEQVSISGNRQFHAFLTQKGPGEVLHFTYGGMEGVQEAILPHIPARDWNGTLLADNLGAEEAAFRIFADGSDSFQTITVPANGSVSLDAKNLGIDWLRVVGDFPQWQFREVFSRAGNVSVMLPLNTQSENNVILPHIPADRDNWWFGLSFVNIWDEVLHLSLTAYDSAGQVLAEMEDDLDPFVKTVSLLEDYWADLPDGVSWIEVESDRPLQGLFLFGTNNGQSLAGLPLTNERARHFLAPVLMDSTQAWHGISLLNQGAQGVEVNLEPYGKDGAPMQSVTMTIEPQQKFTRTLAQLLGEDVHRVGWVRIDSAEPVMAFMLLGPNGFSSIDGFFLPVLENRPRTTVDKINRVYTEEELK